MNISGSSFGIPAVSGGGTYGGGSDQRIKALEEKLQKLNQEKREAERSQDKDKVRELEKQIENVKRQLEQLKRKQQKDKEKKTDKEAPDTPADGAAGALLDRRA